MPVVPFTQRQEPAIPDWAMPSDTHFAMAAAELFDLLNKVPMNPPKPKQSEQPLEPGPRFHELKGLESEMEEALESGRGPKGQMEERSPVESISRRRGY